MSAGKICLQAENACKYRQYKYRQNKYRQNRPFPIKNSWGFIGNGRNVSICVAVVRQACVAVARSRPVWRMLVWQSCGRPVWHSRDLRLPRPRVASAFVRTTTCIDGADGDANASLLIPTTSAWLVGAGFLVVGLPAT